MNVAKPKVLVVEDELPIVELVSFTLSQAGFDVKAVHSVAGAWEYLETTKPDLALLDWMLPDQTGLFLLSRLRNLKHLGDLPVIMLTAKSMEEDKIAGLDNGADDYVTKPFSPRELTARVQSVLRRKSKEADNLVLTLGPISLAPTSCTVALGGQPIDIHHSEYKLLKFLMENAERVYSRGQLLDQVWGHDAVIEERTVDVHILRLRKTLREAGFLIKTIRGVGYMLTCDAVNVV